MTIELQMTISNVIYEQGRRNRGGRGGRAPPRIEDLESKIFENSQNVIFLIIRAPPRLNLFLRPCLFKHFFTDHNIIGSI